ncbi:hypothetical protein BDV38DRAFT_278919 [Aspergillus pseudotamarii]|uniref:Uncharacterized protein n=1 Tax=Aspergillus pseudotamarii TaxID=132259 RepID=A0A5N6T5I9_ASPPS|nr:uncharacterized protein BDV38DRAFT_278919 [Aspergillus pseudotamarii]KAE8141565.1 hypothetical protein BDV38DRAFT_278919 [Aspergillus pseudotamarii]
MKIKHRVEHLNRQLDCSIQGLQLGMGVRQTEGLESLRDQIKNLTLLLKQSLEPSHSLKPKDLGHPWKTGTPDQDIRIDDGILEASSAQVLAQAPSWIRLGKKRSSGALDIPYETRDVEAIPFAGEALPAPISGKSSQQQKQSKPLQPEKSNGDALSIERVYHRLTMKWEPLVNITHRYLYCRSIMHRGAPSSFTPEITIPVEDICPRHNNEGIVRADYGDQDYHQDPYFKQFGGYNTFRAIVLLFFPGVYFKILGQQSFIADERGSMVHD